MSAAAAAKTANASGAVLLRACRRRRTSTDPLTAHGKKPIATSATIKGPYSSQAARANMVLDRSPITLAAARAADVPALLPDLAPDDDRLITSLCQFDFLAAVTIIGVTEKLSTSNWYTNFARFYTSRVTVIAERLLADETMCLKRYIPREVYNCLPRPNLALDNP